MDQHLKSVFRFCPACGTESNDEPKKVPFVCDNCGFHFYFPPTIAVGALIADEDGNVLFIERARDPGKGMLGLPGGFVDCGETGEQAVMREIYEEVGLNTSDIEFLATFPNIYTYKGVTNDVLDIFFICNIETFDNLKIETSEVASYRFAKPDESIYSNMAFESNKKAVQLFAESRC